jgi:hypothetical protein|tara:strand:+ start:6194 stop:6421 length:228 start_codon:yes stop_codon:yes gene_type:complete
MDIDNKYNVDLSYLYKKYKKKIPKKILIDKEKEMKILSTMELQEIWRQKQINIFYKTGRPIYGKYIGSRLVCDIY